MVFIEVFCFSLIILSVIVIVIQCTLVKHNNNFPKREKINKKFCFLVPARYESKVITGLLESIKNQSFKINLKDVYVIVESKDDPTVKICNNMGVTVIVRKKLDGRRRKGYALDDAIKEILINNKKYDAYFIFDADNVLDKDYVKNMIPIMEEGYDLASGYRNCKNGNDNVIAAASAFTFSLVNTFFNTIRCKQSRNITFSGTGFYIKGELIEKWKGYPFTSLTEDYELSNYAILNNLTTYYNTNSVFYDEQPLTYKESEKQRIRWIRGYFDVRKTYAKKIRENISYDDPNFGSKLDEAIGINHYVVLIISLIIYFLANFIQLFINLINQGNWTICIYKFILTLLSVYFMLAFITIILVLLEKDKLDLKLSMKIKVILFNPLFMISYVPCAIKALIKKEVGWDRVEHGVKKD